ncbi:phosphoribosylanthranilate isomerase [Methanobrevibacter curvatus]|uniref:N-(5'-phosphoribosyl)anthranilate isomerase n=1 Tax=Methanobrevibacter curvatus TaxID=49547 RepID=A0A166C4Q4_9EURY|nr:phosphoribosylanthranilate isomerase [Methanobrevibacter curvatus]KZX14125.1 N-(5'-phosphoribosyl)anthranilate isomerase [Methanobrevibacter curvatus]
MNNKSNKNPIKIKICGLKRKEDVIIVNKYKPDYVGFVFAESPRQISPKIAKKLKKSLNKNIKVYGVFVNENIEKIKKLIDENIIDGVQLHGNENKEYINRLRESYPKLTIIKAIELKKSIDIDKIDRSKIDYLLLDSGKGSGKTFDWNLIKNTNTKPFFIAGGLNEKNIEEVSCLEPFAIDISSGAEENGFKSEKKIKKIMNILNKINKNPQK